jgi:hypothetical protein
MLASHVPVCKPTFLQIRTGSDLWLLSPDDLRTLRAELRLWLAANRPGCQAHNAGITPHNVMRRIAQIDAILAKLNAEGVTRE